jgi:uncharacterized damage-inducible protein DinB
MVHLMNIDQRWFCGLRGEPVPGFANFEDYGSDRAKLRAQWDAVEALQRDYLANVTDERLGELYEEPLKVWQVLMHVLNHGTDHRAQILRALHELGAPTFAQDYFFYLIGV